MFERIEARFRQMTPIGDFCSLRLVHDTPHAETCFHQALDIARRQQAKSWELRAATSLARLWQSQDKRQAASWARLAPSWSTTRGPTLCGYSITASPWHRQPFFAAIRRH